MMKRGILGVAFCLLFGLSQAQVFWPSEGSRLHTVNPAILAHSSAQQFSLFYNQQISSVDAGPMQYQAHAVLPFRAQKTALGIQMGLDTEGPFRNMYTQIGYGYGLPLGNNGDVLSLGLAAGFNNARVDMGHFIQSEKNASDQVISNIPENGQWQASVRIGFEYQNGKSIDTENPVQFSAGSSFLQLLQSGANFGAFDYRALYQWMVHVGLSFAASEDMDVMINAFHNDFDYEKISALRVKGTWKDMAWLQLQYGTNKALLTSLGISLSPFPNKELLLQIEASRFWFGSQTIAIFRDNQALQLSVVKPIG